MLKLITDFFKKRNEKKQELKKKTDTLLEGYQDLINEYRLVQEKKSKLSNRQRILLEVRIRYLIAKGHIKIQN